MKLCKDWFNRKYTKHSDFFTEWVFISKSTKKACPTQILKASEPVSMEKNQEEPELTGITDKYGCY